LSWPARRSCPSVDTRSQMAILLTSAASASRPCMHALPCQGPFPTPRARRVIHAAPTCTRRPGCVRYRIVLGWAMLSHLLKLGCPSPMVAHTATDTSTMDETTGIDAIDQSEQLKRKAGAETFRRYRQPPSCELDASIVSSHISSARPGRCYLTADRDAGVGGGRQRDWYADDRNGNMYYFNMW